MTTKRWVWIIGAVVASLIPSHGAQAQDPPDPQPLSGTNAGWSVAPGSRTGTPDRSAFTYEVFPGQILEDTLAVTNLTDDPIDFTLWSGDGYNTRDGSFAIYGADVSATDVGTWVELPVTTVTVNPRSRADVPFTLTVPEDAQPGDHAGGIAALNTTPVGDVDANGADIDVLRAVGARVYVRVAGDLNPRLSVRNVHISGHQSLWPTGGTAVLQYDIVNSGNIRLTPSTATRLEGPFGLAEKQNPPVELRELLPGSSMTVRQEWEDVPPLLRLNATIEVNAEGVDVARKVTLWAVPWLLLAGIGLLAGLFFWRRRRRQARGLRADGSPRTEELVSA